jgi:hypothetical protein
VIMEGFLSSTPKFPPVFKMLDELNQMLWDTQTIKMQVVEKHKRYDDEAIIWFFMNAFPQYRVTEWDIKELRDIFEAFKSAALERMEENAAKAKGYAKYDPKYDTRTEDYDKRVKEDVEAKKGANKRQLMEAYLAFQEKQKSHGKGAAILDHKSKFKKKPGPVGGNVRDGVGHCTPPLPAGRSIKRAVGTRARRMSISNMIHPVEKGSGVDYSFASPDTNDPPGGVNFRGSVGTFEHGEVAGERLKQSAPQNNDTELDGHPAAMSVTQTIPQPEKKPADASGETAGGCATPSQTSKRKPTSQGVQTGSFEQTKRGSPVKKSKTKVVKKGIARVVKKGRR